MSNTKDFAYNESSDDYLTAEEQNLTDEEYFSAEEYVPECRLCKGKQALPFNPCGCRGTTAHICMTCLRGSIIKSQSRICLNCKQLYRGLHYSEELVPQQQNNEWLKFFQFFLNVLLRESFAFFILPEIVYSLINRIYPLSQSSDTPLRIFSLILAVIDFLRYKNQRNRREQQRKRANQLRIGDVQIQENETQEEERQQFLMELKGFPKNIVFRQFK